MSVFVLACVTPPTAHLLNSISTPWVASWWKTQRIAAVETSKQTGPAIPDFIRPKKPWHPSKKLGDQRNMKTQINQLINLQFKACRLPLSLAFIPVVVPSVWQLASVSNLRSSEGKTIQNIFFCVQQVKEIHRVLKQMRVSKDDRIIIFG